ncbi:unnamed protein product [Linum tenue]|uniref:Uncharacterized protein n=1 Tax=Linum tenue TaxID=586396 RepID=A0AAV0L3J9_9ROSI|nr:unnamed protein product [Linum tenue]
MAKLVRGLKTGFLNVVGALKCGGRPATVEAPISPAPAAAAGKLDGGGDEVVYVQEEANKVHFVGGAKEDLYVGEAEYESVQVLRIVQNRNVGVPRGSRPGTG